MKQFDRMKQDKFQKLVIKRLDVIDSKIAERLGTKLGAKEEEELIDDIRETYYADWPKTPVDVLPRQTSVWVVLFPIMFFGAVYLLLEYVL